MSKNLKKVIASSLIIVVIISIIIATFFIVKFFNNKKTIDNVCQIYSNDNIQDRLDNTAINKESNNNDLTMQIDGETVLGVISIDKIGFKGLVYEGTSLDTLKKGVGHFSNSSYFEGNVCLAAHNTNSFWAKLHTMQNGDKITYTSFLGTKEYQVSSVKQISETDWSNLENTNENILTLITCVKGKSALRLCVQALEVH